MKAPGKCERRLGWQEDKSRAIKTKRCHQNLCICITVYALSKNVHRCRFVMFRQRLLCQYRSRLLLWKSHNHVNSTTPMVNSSFTVKVGSWVSYQIHTEYGRYNNLSMLRFQLNPVSKTYTTNQSLSIITQYTDVRFLRCPRWINL